jgi:transposase
MKDEGYDLRFRLVCYAEKHGIRQAAKAFHTTRHTVRKFLRRFQDSGKLSSLVSLSRRPFTCPHQTPKAVEEKVLEIRRRVVRMGAKRMKAEFALPCSHAAISRICKQHGLVRKRWKKYQRKQDLREMKALWGLFEQISTDTKDLKDLPPYWLQMKALGLPSFEYTAREVVSGTTFLGFANENSATYASLFADIVCQHLKDHDVDLALVNFQTDNGSEFKGGKDKQGNPHGFPMIVETKYLSHHRRIPPAAHTFQSDVETFHRLVEDEFFLIEPFSSKDNFKMKITSYLLYFNLVRKNSYKGWKSPWEIIQDKNKNIKKSIVMLPPIFLDEIFNPRLMGVGHDVPWIP